MDAGGGMIIRRSVRLQLLAFALLAALGVSYVGVNYVGVGDVVFKRTYTVAADFPDSGGIFTGAEVTYRGVPVGRVGELRLHGDGVRVELRLRRGVQVPSEVLAVVANRSAVGEQFVDLQPRRAGAPYLEAGAVIPRDRTLTPLSTTTLLVNLDRLVGSVDNRQLTTVIDELGRAFAGTGPDLQRLIDSGDQLTTAAERNLPQTVRLLDDGLTVLRTQNQQAGAIKSFARDLALLTDQVRTDDPQLRKVLDDGPDASREVTRLLRTTRPTLPILLGNLITVGQVTSARIPGLEQILVAYPQQVAATFTVAPGDRTAHFGLVLNIGDPSPCTRGYEGTDKRVPQETSARPANAGAHCAEPRGSRIDVRGAQNAPRAGHSGASGGSPSGAPGQGAGASPAQAVYVAGYDPATGQAIGPDGEPITIGSFGGQQRYLGKDSWTWLLIGPLAG
jgi:phospholipid/cholesterol/gamma-HCH transport system substrate-binding protein